MCAHTGPRRRHHLERLRDRARRRRCPGPGRGRDRRPRRRPRAACLPEGRPGLGRRHAGPASTRCAIRNVDGGRMLAVISVDGVNVVSGETAAPAQSGYVLGPYGFASRSPAGARTSRTPRRSTSPSCRTAYAARTGRPDNVGVIGVAVFRERIPPVVGKIGPARPNETDGAPAPYPLRARRDPTRRPAKPGARCGGRRRDGRSEGGSGFRSQGGGSGGAGRARAARRAAPRAGRAAVRAGPGAGGEARHRPRPQRELADADGDASSAPADSRREMIAIHYDRRENLVAMGVLPRAGRAGAAAADAVPGLRRASRPIRRAERKRACAKTQARTTSGPPLSDDAPVATRAGRSHTRGRCPRNPFRPPATRR